MSDLEKVYSYAVGLGSSNPVQLRWEGAGDCSHVYKILSSLKNMSYPGSSIRIKYHAIVNIYESDASEIYYSASSSMERCHWGTTDDQTYEIHAGMNVTRDSRVTGQRKAHIMFVRNIMPTNESGESLTNGGNVLHEIHTGALRNRSNSLKKKGAIRLGMSGAPGLISDSTNTRMEIPVKQLFTNAKSLVDTASESGLKVKGKPTRKGSTDYDVSNVMKNNGISLGKKATFYLTFVK